MRKVFVINGFPGVGKSTFGRLVGRRLGDRNINFAHISSIDPIKNILGPRVEWDRSIPFESKMMFQILKNSLTQEDWDGKTKNAAWRDIMSDMKAAVNDRYPDFINHWLLENIYRFPEPLVTFVDIREGRDINSFREYCFQNGLEDFATVFVEGVTNEGYANLSDANVRDFMYDITVVNEWDEDKSIIKNFDMEAERFIQNHILNEDHEDREGEVGKII